MQGKDWLNQRSKTLWDILRWTLLSITILFIGGYVGIVFFWLGQFKNDYPTLHARIVVGIHVISGCVMIFGGTLQIIPQIRQRWPKFHRINGYIIYVAGIISGVGAFGTSLYAFGGPAVTLSGLLVSLYWILTIVMGYVRIIQKNIQGHREWMIRFYTLAYAIIFMRVVVIICSNVVGWSLPASLGAGIPATWLFFILCAEFYIASTRSKSIPAQMTINGEMLVSFPTWTKLKLIERHQMTANVSTLVFQLPHSSMRTYVPPGHHILLKARCGKKIVIRPYSPVDLSNKSGIVEFVIKRYEGGLMSTHLHHTLNIGDEISVKGSMGEYEYQANQHKHILLMAGGSGITPIISIARAILSNPFDTTRITFFNANRSESDVVLLDELKEMASNHPDRFQLVCCISRPRMELDDQDIFEKGRITKEIIEKNAPESKTDASVLICGPRPMCFEMMGLVHQMGYPKRSVFAFGVSDQ